MDKFFELVDSAIAISRENRKQFAPKDFSVLSQYLCELATVKIDCGRRAGKTSYVIEHARPWDIVVVPNFVAVHQLYRGCSAKVLIIDELLSDRLFLGRQRPTPATIYVDEISAMRGVQVAEIWGRLGCHPDQTMVVLG